MTFGKRETSPFRVVILLFIGSLACMGTFVLSIDELCRTDIARRQPIYPNAEIVEQDYNFLRPRATGVTTTLLHTPDDEETVRQWMREVTLDLLDHEEFWGMATVDWRAEDNPRGSGTLIYLYSSCAE